MKSVKGKLLKKLKSIKPIGYLKPDRILHVNAADGFVETLQTNPIFKIPQKLFNSKESNQEKPKERKVLIQEPDIIDVAELMRDLEEDEAEEMDVDFDDDNGDKENVGPPPFNKENDENLVRKMDCSSCSSKHKPLSEINISSFRRPDLNSGTLFDPNLLAAFEKAVKDHINMGQARIEQENVERKEEEAYKQSGIEQENVERKQEAEKQSRMEKERIDEEEEPPLKTRRIEKEEEEEEEDPLLEFDEKCPPGGSNSVILYTTSLRGIRKTFEECNSIRFLLESFRVIFFERDVSMHIEFKEELWNVLQGKIMPPRLFIKGRYIGGAEEVLRLHEQGKFRVLFNGIPIERSIGRCESCVGFRFVLCFNCNGSHRIIQDNGFSNKCIHCNENGLIICPLCC